LILSRDEAVLSTFARADFFKSFTQAYKETSVLPGLPFPTKANHSRYDTLHVLGTCQNQKLPVEFNKLLKDYEGSISRDGLHVMLIYGKVLSDATNDHARSKGRSNDQRGVISARFIQYTHYVLNVAAV
jgi:hypothetical protein